jgi:ketosteroid isomerase-like protein
VSEHLDLVRSIYEALNRGDLGEHMHTDIEFMVADGLIATSSSGAATAETRWRDFRAAWEDLSFEVEESRELDNERVLVLVRRSGRGKRSGVALDEVQARGADLFHIRDGRVTKAIWYWDRDRALADLGLEG